MHAERAGVAGVLLHLGGNGAGHVAAHQRAGALLGNALQHGGQFGVAQQVPGGPGRALGVIKIGGGNRVGFERRFFGQKRGHARADGKACIG